MKQGTARIALILTGVALATGIFLMQVPQTAARGDQPPTAQSDDETEIIRLVDQAVASNQRVLAFIIFDVRVLEVEFSEDRGWALVWLGYADPSDGQMLPTEPGLAIARRAVGDGNWWLFLPSDPGWSDNLNKLPEGLLSAEAKEAWLQRMETHALTQGGPFGGYLLPWAAGEQKFLTRSISHGVGGTMHYAFDFAEIGFPSAMFQIYASKGGTVKWAEWTYPNGYSDGNCNHQNYIVLEHTSTSPTTYSMYLHLAENSIPADLRVAGAVVQQGQLVGTADDTGCSSGNHLHLQTHTNPFSYWGSSVDMTFDDVAINGGRPRTVAEAAAYPQHGSEGQDIYTSGNTVWGDLDPPIGNITNPSVGDRVESDTLTISGYAYDTASGLDQAQMVAFYNGKWNDVSTPIVSSPWTLNWNLCADRVPDGPVSLGLNITDLQGNLTSLAGLTHLTKDFNCPPQPPACQPGPNQIAIYSEIDYEGTCRALGLGDHSTPVAWSPVADDDTASILVGTDVLATLYTQDLFGGRSQTIYVSNSNLAEDPVGSDTVSSIRVMPAAGAPNAPAPVWPSNGQVLSMTQTIDLVWSDGGGGAQFQTRLLGTTAVTSTWLTRTHWLAGELSPGSYTWQVRSRNNQIQSNWSTTNALTITAVAPITLTGGIVPYTEDFETGIGEWQASGLWHWEDNPANAHSGSRSFWFGSNSTGNYEAPQAHVGDLTSPPVAIPASGYALRFWSRAETESPHKVWDQRRVLISEDGGPFETIFLMTDDPVNFWVQSPAIDLSNYAGKTIQVRFHFATLDDLKNNFQGWLIDDVEISAYTPPTCADSNEPNDSPSQASALTIGASASGDVCPAGDQDFFSFSGVAGDRIVLDVDAEVNGSNLDSLVFVLDSDGNSELAQNDDEVAFVLHDSILGYQIPRNGNYYVKLQAWDHPSAGSPLHPYSLSTYVDNTDPALSVTNPVSRAIYTSTVVTLQAQATDGGSGVRRVEFLWHSNDWQGGDWQLLFEDTDGSDGWAFGFDPNAFPEGTGMAFFIRATDWAGNVTGEGFWNIGIDRTPPDTNVLPLPPTLQSTAVLLEWTGSDNATGIQSYDLQSRRDLEPWTDFQNAISATTTSEWFIGDPDHVYAFRSRGTDLAGNVEGYPGDGDTLTYLSGCTAPDVYEVDDTAVASSMITPTLEVQTHNLCAIQDKDWLKFQAVSGQHYRIIVNSLHPSTAVQISLYAADGSTLLATDGASAFGTRTELGWTALSDSDLYIELRHFNGDVAGDAVSYSVWIAEGYSSYLPALLR